MDQQILQIIKDAATVIQALLDERSQMMQQMMAAQQQEQPQQQPQEKQASWGRAHGGFSQPVLPDTDKTASSGDDALSRFMAAQAEILEGMGVYTGTTTW